MCTHLTYPQPGFYETVVAVDKDLIDHKKFEEIAAVPSRLEHTPYDTDAAWKRICAQHQSQQDRPPDAAQAKKALPVKKSKVRH